MLCPNCDSKYGRVINTRQEGPETTIRQRICLDCAHTFHTVEVHLPPMSIRWTAGKSMERIEGYKGIRFF
jgi:transcriptional regulator NrdR family protein